MKLTTIVDRYVFKEALGLYLLGLTGFLTFLVINQIFLEWNLHYGPGVEFTDLLLLVVYRIPEYTVLSIPIAVLFATLMAMGRLGNDNELTAIFTNGISLYRLFLPFLYLALPNVLLSFYISDQWVPWASRQSAQVLEANPALREQVEGGSDENNFDPFITRLGDRYLAAAWVNRETGRTGGVVIDDLGGVIKEKSDADGTQAASSEGAAGPAEQQTDTPRKDTGAASSESGGSESDEDSGASTPDSRSPPQSIQNDPLGATGPANGGAGSSPAADPSESQPGSDLRRTEEGLKWENGDSDSGEQPQSSGGQKAQSGSENQTEDLPGEAERLQQRIDQTQRTEELLGEADYAGHRILYGSSGHIEGDMLSLYGAWEYVVDGEGNLIRAHRLGTYRVQLERPLQDIYSQIKDPDELTRDQLQTLVKQSEELGINAPRAATKLYLKYSKPFAPLFLALIGMPLSLRAPRDERLLGLILTYVLVFVYYLIYFVGRLLGFNGIVHPFLAAWTHNIVYAAAALVIFASVRK